MAFTYEEVLSALGEDAQCVPGAIVVFGSLASDATSVQRHIIVGEVGLHGGFAVTPDGLELLAERAPKKQPVSGKKQKAAQAPQVPVASAEDGLDLA